MPKYSLLAKPLTPGANPEWCAALLSEISLNNHSASKLPQHFLPPGESPNMLRPAAERGSFLGLWGVNNIY